MLKSITLHLLTLQIIHVNHVKKIWRFKTIRLACHHTLILYIYCIFPHFLPYYDHIAI